MTSEGIAGISYVGVYYTSQQILPIWKKVRISQVPVTHAAPGCFTFTQVSFCNAHSSTLIFIDHACISFHNLVKSTAVLEFLAPEKYLPFSLQNCN